MDFLKFPRYGPCKGTACLILKEKEGSENDLVKMNYDLFWYIKPHKCHKCGFVYHKRKDVVTKEKKV